MTFEAFFQQATGNQPFPYQIAFAQAESLPRAVEVPTGGGKTAFAVLGWLWRRRAADAAIRTATPRRLVYCLPVRTLVDQTLSVIRPWLQNLGLEDEIGVHGLLGGALDESWELQPERDLILVGTQDQLLSRALNRGYSMSRYRWPLHSGMLNNDVLWVLDEVQLMGVGLSTTAQLQAFRDSFSTYGPAQSLWMSATIDTRLLGTIDFRANIPRPSGITEADRSDERLGQRLRGVKQLHQARTLAGDKSHAKDLAREVVNAHQANSLTLVIVNRVARAQQIVGELRKLNPEIPVALIHSRFRPADRRARVNEVLSGRWTGILVATQAIEAGVDVSARTLFTELAPWSSLVQRFGRCNRRGEFETAHVYWIDLPDDDKIALPYDVPAMAHARNVLVGLDQVGIDRLPDEKDETVNPVGPVLRRREVIDLFDTQPDLSGSDVDVSRYIRAPRDRDAQVFWRLWPDGADPDLDDEPHQDELCTAPCWEVTEVAKRRNRGRHVAFRWNGQTAKWEPASRIVPGMQILLHAGAGGYDVELGWLAASTVPVEPVIRRLTAPQDSDLGEEPTTVNSRFITIVEHTRDVVNELDAILTEIRLPVPSSELRTAAFWHDVGKVHPAFQQLLLDGLPEEDPHRSNGPWAKSPTGRGGRITRRFFRHELVSSLALLAHGGGDLEAFLVAAHHGKVRLSIRSRPGETTTVLGVQEGDRIGPLSFDVVDLPETVLDLRVARLGRQGEADSWLDRMLRLLDQYGPFRLAYLEALLCSADRRASARVSQPTEALL